MEKHFDMTHLIFQSAKPRFLKTELLDMMCFSCHSCLKIPSFVPFLPMTIAYVRYNYEDREILADLPLILLSDRKAYVGQVLLNIEKYAKE